MRPLHTVVQLDEFIRQAKAIMSEDEREQVVNFLAAHPESGTSLGGGLYKVRIPRPGGGKSGGFRTIYLFIGDDVPIFLMTVFAKNQKANLTSREKTALIDFGKTLVTTYGATK